MECYLVEIFLCHCPAFIRGYQASVHGCFANEFKLQSGTVITDCDDDFTAFIVGPQTDQSAFVFSQRAALLRGFNAVIDIIADNMHERIKHFIEYFFIYFNVSALYYEIDFDPKDYPFLAWRWKVRVESRKVRPWLPNRMP